MNRLHALDLTRYAFKRTFGDITAYGTWYGKEHDPVLVLIPTYRQSHEKTTPCVVPLTNAWKWDEMMGDPEGCAHTCVKFASLMGFDPLSRITAQRIASIIRDNIGDLLHIPPKPVEHMEVVADAFMTDESGKTKHLEVSEHV